MGTFYRLTKADGTPVKIGGNVVAYFCTPRMEIVHAVWGAESPEEFLRQATWAAELAKRLHGAKPEERAELARKAHEESPYRMSKGAYSWTTVQHYHRCARLRESVLAPLTTCARELFEALAGERVSDEEVRTPPAAAPVPRSPAASSRTP